MKILENSRITTKIISLLAMLGVLTVAIGWIGSNALRRTNGTYTALVGDLTSSIKMTQVNMRIAVMTRSGYQAMAYDGASRQAKAAALAEKEAYDGARTRLADVEKAQPESAAKILEFRAGVEALHALTGEAVALGLANRNAEAIKLLEQADSVSAPLAKAVTAFNEAQILNGTTGSETLDSATSATSWTLMILAIVGAIGGMVVSFLVARFGITGPLNSLREIMSRLAAGEHRVEVPGVERGDEVGAMAKTVLVFRDAAVAQDAAVAEKVADEARQQRVVEIVSASLASLSDGDLTAAIESDFPRNFQDLKDNFNAALGNLRALIGGVTRSAHGIRTGSQEIAQASEDLARRTEGNAASLEETSAALVQIDTRLRATALSSSETVARADQAIATVGGGRATAEQAVQAMGRVSDSAKGIDSVIEGLDKIAFQTRVLAMNAAVEAGRAGDAGRGFAVVADLVSALAMRAEEEAKRARDQLTLTQTDIVTAVQAVQKVDGALANISGDVGEVHTLLGTMADDATAQSSAISQITAAIGAMDQSTQQNAAMVEQTSAAARNLTAEVGSLSEHAAAFRVEDGPPARRAQPAASPAPLRAGATKKAAAPYRSPVKASPAMASAGGADDWNAF
ncbi:methyl-accepting chemotaxis protein [Sphingomonas sp. RT2P30]|uniref:methyl-accepting chemotaxis protein n=1 Tax=Parasphingomonas halimpatiens TaxID=3096162 RepID=UPI002FC87AAC